MSEKERKKDRERVCVWERESEGENKQMKKKHEKIKEWQVRTKQWRLRKEQRKDKSKKTQSIITICK